MMKTAMNTKAAVIPTFDTTLAVRIPCGTTNPALIKLRDRRNEEIVRLYKSVIKKSSIAIAFDLSPITINRICAAYNWQHGDNESLKQRHAEKKEQMLKLRREGLSNVEIAKRMGCDYHTVRNHIGRQPKEMTSVNLSGGRKMAKLKRDTRVEAKEAMQNIPAPTETDAKEAVAAPIMPNVSEITDNLINAVAEKLVLKILEAFKATA